MEQQMHFDALRKTLASLKKAIAKNKPKDEFIRDAAIRRFEYAYELAYKLLKQHLEHDEGRDYVYRLSRKDLFRLAAEKGLIASAADWFNYHAGRNEAAHVYDDETAERVYVTASRFAADAVKLLAELEARSLAG